MDATTFAKKIRDEAHEFNCVNMQVLDFDEEMQAIELAIAEAIESGDEARILDTARRGRQGIIDLGYAGSDELPAEDDEA